MSNSISEFCSDQHIREQHFGYCVYAIRSKNGMSYVGSTTNLSKRIRRHYYELINNKHHSLKLQLEFNKNRSELSVFVLESVKNGSNVKFLRDREQFWIDKLNSYREGFNSKSRAEGPEVGLLTYAYNLKICREKEFINQYLTKVNYKLSATNEDRENYKSEYHKTIEKRCKFGFFLLLVFLFGFHFEIILLMVFALVASVLTIFPLPKTLENISQDRIKKEEKLALLNAKTFAINSLARIMSYERMIDVVEARKLIESCEQEYKERQQRSDIHRMKSNYRRRMSRYL